MVARWISWQVVNLGWHKTITYGVAPRTYSTPTAIEWRVWSIQNPGRQRVMVFNYGFPELLSSTQPTYSRSRTWSMMVDTFHPLPRQSLVPMHGPSLHSSPMHGPSLHGTPLHGPPLHGLPLHVPQLYAPPPPPPPLYGPSHCLFPNCTIPPLHDTPLHGPPAMYDAYFGRLG